MADENYYQHDGLDYPFIEGLPRAIDDVDFPYPSSFYAQMDDEYPFLLDLPVELKISSPYPSSFYAQNENVNDGYPYIDLPEAIEKLTKPLPYIMYKPNKAKKFKCVVVIDNSDDVITVPKYEEVLDYEVII